MLEQQEPEMRLSVSEQLRLIFFRTGIKIGDTARAVGMSPQSFSAKLRRSSFTYEELEKIGELTGCRFVQYFEMPNGEKIGSDV